MTPGFSVKFVIDRLTANYKIQITDTTDYTGVSTAYGFYRIEYPDGLWVENTDPLNPDFQLGQTFSEFTFRLKNFVPMAGQYRIIQKTYTDTGDVQTTKTITFSFIEPSMSLANSSNMAVPSVSFTDTTNYDLGFYTEVVTKTITGTFPLSLPFGGTQVSTSGNTVDMVYGGSYYEGLYLATVQASVVYTGTDHVIEWSKSQAFTFDIRKLIPYSDILQFLDIAKTRYDAAKGTTNEAKERENYQLVSALVDHIQLKAVSVSPGISSLMLEIQALIYKVTCTFIDEYVYSTDPVPPIDSQFFTEGVPLNRVLTINGVAQDLTQDRVWNVGTVTSVNVAAPSWMTVSGGPITESGVITLGLAAGYVIPTEGQVAEWGLAYDKYIIGIGVSGSATKTITLTRNDGTLLTAQFNDIDTFPVTSVNTKTGDVVLITDDIQEGVGAVNLWFTQDRARASVSLTTTGNSGASTYDQSTGVFNVPNYTLAGLGGVPLTRNITINGVQFDLSADRVWNVGTVTQINTGAGLIGGPITGSGTISHADTSALLGLYGGSGIASITVDEFGHITAVVSASYVPTSRTLSINGVQFDLSANRSWNVGTVTSVDMTVPIGFAISGNPITTAGTLALGFATGYSLPTDIRQGQWDVAYDNRITSLTTIGNSGASTLINHVLNIPNYTLAGLGGVPLTRNITINGQTFDLSEDRVFTVDIGVASASGVSPIVVTPSTGNIVVSHADSPVTPGTYNTVTVDQKGHVTLGANVNDQNNFVRVLRIPSYMIDFSNDIKVEIANYINQMNPPLDIEDTDSKWNIVIEYSVPDLLDSSTEINIWFDNSGSMNDVLEPIVNTLSSCLKSLLLPIYGTSALYEQRVKINSFTGDTFTVNGTTLTLPGKTADLTAEERTFMVLNTMGSSDEITRVINIVFQDEAHDVYHNNPFDGSVKPLYSSDIASLKSVLSTKKDPNYYKGVIYRLTGTSTSVAFRAFLEAAATSSGSFTGTNSLEDLVSSGKLRIEYDVAKLLDPYFYLNLMRNTFISMGFTNVGATEDLVCFVPITGLISVGCTDPSGTNGYIDVGGLSGGSGSGYYFILNEGTTQYTPGIGATGLADDVYQIRVFDDEGNNYEIGIVTLSCFTALSGTVSSACSSTSQNSGSIDVANVSGGSGTGYYFTLNNGATQYTPGVGVTGLADGSYLVTLFDSTGASISLGTVNIACVQTYNINRYLCGTCTQIGTGAVEYNPAFPLQIGKFYRLTNGEIAQVTGLSNFSVTNVVADTLTYYNSCAEAPCA